MSAYGDEHEIEASRAPLLDHLVELRSRLIVCSAAMVVGTGTVSVELLPKVSDYLSLVTALLLSFGLCFQLPVVLSLLGMAGLVTSKLLASGRRYAVVAVFIVAAILTPPDPISMMTLALPGLLLYEVSIFCVWLIELRRKDGPASTAIVT